MCGVGTPPAAAADNIEAIGAKISTPVEPLSRLEAGNPGPP